MPPYYIATFKHDREASSSTIQIWTVLYSKQSRTNLLGYIFISRSPTNETIDIELLGVEIVMNSTSQFNVQFN
jgi:hypothetical protein